MPKIEVGDGVGISETGAGSGDPNIYELDETRSYTLVLTTQGDVAIDGGAAVTIPVSVTVVLGPGIGKATVADSATAVGFIVPRSDSRM